MVENPETPFCAILGWPFSGDVLNNTPDIFRGDGAASNAADGSRKRSRESWGSHFAQFLIGCFLGMF
jgi:hypothetical protein